MQQPLNLQSSVSPSKSGIQMGTNFESFITQSFAPIAIITGKNLIFTFANDAYSELMNHRQLIGKSVEEAIPELKGQPFIDILLQVMETGIACYMPSIPATALYKGNDKPTTRYFNLTYTPYKNDVGEIDGILASAFDVTDEVNMRKQLEQKNEALEKMNQELQSFNYISSHDLQEPLRKIQTFSARIESKESSLTEESKFCLQRLQSAAHRMRTLIDDLLIYSSIEEKDLIFKSCSLEELVTEIMIDLEEEISKTNGTISIPTTCEVKVIPFQFRQLLQNLITNALKFAKPNEAPVIIINGHHKKGSDIGNVQGIVPEKFYAHISVVDNGIGFDPAYKEKIFQLLQRLHSKDKYPGTGIGLAIVKRIVENHKAIITATGDIGKGASFDVYLPY